jgi:hypothetical protein
MYAQIARHIILKHKPQLLMLHLMSADGFQHGTGRRTPVSMKSTWTRRTRRFPESSISIPASSMRNPSTDP